MSLSFSNYAINHAENRPKIMTRQNNYDEFGEAIFDNAIMTRLEAFYEVRAFSL